MCEALRELMKDEIAEDIEKAREGDRAQAIAEGRTEGLIESIRNLMKNVGMTTQEAMNALGISVSEQKRLLTML